MELQETTRRLLRIVTTPANGHSLPVIARVTSDPFYMGGGDTDLLCGNCEWTLAHRVDPDLLPEAIIKCPRCDRYNHNRDFTLD